MKNQSKFLKNKVFKIAFYDLESSALRTNQGTIISGVVRMNGKEKVFTNKKLGIDGLDDKEIIMNIRNELDKADMVVGYYHLNFDNPFLNTKLLKYGEKLLDPKLQVDLYRVVKRFKFLTDRRNMDTVAKFLGIPLKKTHIDWEEWRKAAINGDKEAIKEVVWHNVVDVRVTELIFHRVKGLIKSISIA